MMTSLHLEMFRDGGGDEAMMLLPEEFHAKDVEETMVQSSPLALSITSISHNDDENYEDIFLPEVENQKTASFSLLAEETVVEPSTTTTAMKHPFCDGQDDTDMSLPKIENKKSLSLPKAGLARLAKDAGARLSTGDYERVQEELFFFLSTVLRHARRALVFTKLKSVSRRHVEFAIRASGQTALAEHAKTLKDKELDRLHRCNIYAAPAVRRAPIGAVEISEATFSRILKILAKVEDLNCRFGSRARRLLHLCSEIFLVDFIISSLSEGNCGKNVGVSVNVHSNHQRPYSSLKRAAVVSNSDGSVCFEPMIYCAENGDAVASSSSDSLSTPLPIPPNFVVRALSDAFGIPSESSSSAVRLAQLFETVASRLDPLLEAKSTKTVSEELLAVALAETDSIIISNDMDNNKKNSSIRGIKVVENLLRGRAPDRWVTHGAIKLLTRVLGHHLAALGEREMATT